MYDEGGRYGFEGMGIDYRYWDDEAAAPHLVETGEPYDDSVEEDDDDE